MFVRGIFVGIGFCLFMGAWMLALTFILLFGLQYFLPLLKVVRIFCILFAVCTGVVGVKWRREAAIRYHSQGGSAGTP